MQITKLIHNFLGCMMIVCNQIELNQTSSIQIETKDLLHNNCSDQFLSHPLEHITSVAQRPIGYYDSNGAGLAINDLDRDGDLDLVLANLDGDNAIFWNGGRFTFEKEPLPSANQSRGVSIVDVDGDQWLDIVFTQRAAAPLYWHNQQGNAFEKSILRGVSYPAYAMDWADIDTDGDLDLVTGSYDVELDKVLGQSAQTAGVIYYENDGDQFVATRLTGDAQSLAILLHDLNQDNRPDVIVGNDFSLPDQYFTYSSDSWSELTPMPVMPHSTMSYDAADINNDGYVDLYAVDMKPYSSDESLLEAWQPVIEQMQAIPQIAGDPQVMANVLYVADQNGNFRNLARGFDLDATGWSWSAKFGDLDNDGFQDLYVVNGMISIEMFSHLPDNELVEENQVYRNHTGWGFEPMPSWNLNSTASGRGMSMADLDNDGDLDIVVNNLLDNAVVYENQLCGGSSITVDLRWQGIANTHAIGTVVELHTNHDVYQRQVRAVSGYLSGDPSRLHFGFPSEAEIVEMHVRWNDGVISTIPEVEPNTRVTVTRITPVQQE